MRPAIRLPRHLRLGWRDLDLGFLRFVGLSLVAHAMVAASGPIDPPVPIATSSTFGPVGFVLGAPAAPPSEVWPPDQGVHEILGSPAGGGPFAGDLLAGGGIDEDLMAVLSRVQGVRLPRPGERPGVRPTPRRGAPGAGCSYDPKGRLFCACF